MSQKVTWQIWASYHDRQKGKTTKNAKRWTQYELELFVEVLADPEKNFAISLKKFGKISQLIMKYLSISKIHLRLGGG